MVSIQGEMAVLLGVVGLKQGDDRILDAIALVGPKMDVADDSDSDESTHFIFGSSGTEFVFEDDVLEAIMVRTQPATAETTWEGSGLYPRLSALVEGLSPTATRGEVVAFLGTPERTGEHFVCYEANGRYLHVEFDAHGRAAMFTALREAV